MIYQLMNPSSLGKMTAFDLAGRRAGLPGIDCVGLPECCGNKWSHNGLTIRMPISADHYLYKSSKFPLRPDAFKEFSSAARRSLNLPEDTLLGPGTKFGYQRLRYVHSPIADFEWVHIRTLIVSERLREMFIAQGITGWCVEPVEFAGEPPPASAGPFWELVIEGRGGRAITQPETRLLSICPVCGREEYDRGMLRENPLAPDQWDGSDFFYFDPPENGLFFMTERAKMVFERLGLREAYHPLGME